MASEGKGFSEEALAEVDALRKLITDLYGYTMKAYEDEDFDALDKANEVEEKIDDFTKMMEDNHVARMNAGVCTPSVGVHYLELSSDTERIADHLINVAKSIRSLK